jgi:AcrR family transcriptional regulator
LRGVPTRKRGPYQRTQERREQIALAVLELVDEVGHEGVTTALVAARSGTPEPTILYHYPTRDHLLVAALERVDDLESDLAGAEDPGATLDLEALRREADPTVRTSERRLRLFYLLKGQAATPGHPAVEYYERRARQAMEIFARLIVARQRAGLAHPGLDPYETARQIFAMWDGLTAMRLNDREFDIATALVDGVRRLTGENYMQMVSKLTDPQAGL